MRATTRVGTSSTSAARRAATSVLTCCAVGTSTLPPRWPHFFSEESWSSKCTPAAPASIIAFISSKAFSGPPKPASASATIGASQWVPLLPSAVVDLVGAQQRVVEPADERRGAVGRVEALVGVRVAGEVRVGGDLPAGEVDRLQPRLDHLHGLAAGHRAERGDAGLGRGGAARAAPRRGARACARCGRSRAGASTSAGVYGRSIPSQRSALGAFPFEELTGVSYSLSWSRSQKSGHVHSATAAVGSATWCFGYEYPRFRILERRKYRVMRR